MKEPRIVNKQGFHLYFEQGEYQQAAKAATEQDLSLAQLIRKLLREHIEVRKTNERINEYKQYRRA